MQTTLNRLYTFQRMHGNKKQVSETNRNSGKMCRYRWATTTTNPTVRASEAPPLPSTQPLLSLQCCHGDGKAPSFALVLWIDDGCHGTFVDGILTLGNGEGHVWVGQRWTTPEMKMSKPTVSQRGLKQRTDEDQTKQHKSKLKVSRSGRD